MKFNNEEEFRRWIVAELPKYLGQEWTVLQGKNVSDIVMCWNSEIRPLIMFIEAKYHKAKHGRIGFGGGKGKGYQTELLLKKPLYTEKYLRWIVADQDSEQCLLFDNDDVRNNCAKQIRAGKHNNFTSGLFKKNRNLCFNLREAARRIAAWAKENQLKHSTDSSG